MKTRLLTTFLVTLLFVGACGGDEAGETTTIPTTMPPLPATTTTTSSTTTVPQHQHVWPLTGLPAESDPADAPVLVAKIDNTSNSRPQLGLGEADMVIEVPVEGGIPRLLAFFQSSIPDEIGPIRSTREVDPKLLAPFSSLFASSGGQNFVLSDVRAVATDIGFHVLGSEAYYRDPGRPSLYDVILRTADVPQLAISATGSDSDSDSAYADKEDPEITEASDAAGSTRAELDEWLVFGDPPAGEQALTINVSQSSLNQVEYRYSAADGGYLRFHRDVAHETEQAGTPATQQVVANNVVIIYVPVLSTGRTDSSGSPVPDYNVTGSGDTVVFRDGVGVSGTWERGSEDQFFRFFELDGDEIALAPGTTWIELTPNGRSVEWQ